MTDELCPICQEILIPGCRNENRGGGIILKQDADGIEYAEPCKNMVRVAMRRYMKEVHPLLLEVPLVKDTPLYKHKELDRTKDNLFFSKVEWGTFLAHLKWVLGYKYFSKSFVKIVTDMKLLNIYVGNASLKARLKSQQDEDQLLICNSLEDLLESPDLVIVRLGLITHFNRAAANVLQEALNIRKNMGRPVWLIEPHNKGFQPYRKADFGDTGMPCCNDDVLNYVQQNFETIELETVEGAQIQEEADYTVDGDTVALGDESESLLGEFVSPEEVEQSTDSDVDDLVGPEKSKPKKKAWKKNKSWGDR